jgi:PAS domain S-box-containing protein
MSPDQPPFMPGPRIEESASQVAAVKREGVRALDESEGRYRRLIEGISGDYVIYTHTPEGTLTYVSPSVENVLGFSPTTIVGLDWRDLVGEKFMGREDADRVQEEVAAGKKFHKFMVEIAHADGSTRLLEIQQRPLFDEAGNYVSMEGIAKDITAAVRNAEELRKLQEDLERLVYERTAELSLKNELLRKSEARYRSVVEDQTEFITRWLPNRKHTFANSAYCRYFDKTPEEVIGKSFMPTVYEEDRELLEKHIRSLTPDCSHTIIQHRVYRPDGTVGWMEWTNRALFDEEGHPLEYQSVGRDITDLKHAADTIREKEAHLAHVLRLSTMGELVAGIAHEVHQPLHAAKTFAEAARRALEAGFPNGVENAIECTKEISEAINRTAKIIRHLREFTKARPVEFESLDLSSVVKGASKIISYETRRAHVKLQIESLGRAFPIQGDRVHLEQACINLMINAYEAMEEIPEDQRSLLIVCSRNEGTVRLTFRDVGCGIGKADAARIFDAFYTLKPGGMGMGLSLCKSIAEAHGGNIWVEENEGPGMTFVLSLPQASQFPKELMPEPTCSYGGEI